MLKNPLLAIACVAAALIWTAGPAFADETIRTDKPTAKDGYYGDRDEGWFWYHDPKDDPPPAPPPPPKPGTGQGEKPKVLSAQWIRENLDRYRYAAIDNPTKDNMELYLLLQKLALDKSEQFALASRAYASQNPGIDETVQNPTSAISRNSLTESQEKSQNDTIRKIAKRAGIYYFYRSDCPFCHQQNPTLEILTRMTGLTIIPIALDDAPSQDGLLPNWRPDQGQAEYLGVTKTPTMYLVEPGGKVQLLSVGVRSLPEIRSRTIQLAVDSGWITREEYDFAMRGLPRKFLTDGLNDKTLEDDPDKLLAVLRDASTYGKQEASFTEMDGGGASPWKKKGQGTQ